MKNSVITFAATSGFIALSIVLMPVVPSGRPSEVHRRLSAALDADSRYHEASHRGLPRLVARLVKSTFAQR